MSALVAGMLSAAAAGLLLRSRPARRLRRILGPGGPRPGAGLLGGQLRAGHGGAWWPTRSGPATGRPVRWWPVPGRRGERPGVDPAELAEQVAALARAGLPAVRIWQALAEAAGPAGPLCAAVATQVLAGGQAGPALRSAGGPPALAWLAVACDVADRAGAPQAEVLERFAVAVRADAAAAADRDTALAGPRATATVLSWLPLGGVLLGALLGADPVSTLFGTTAGRICLLIGGGFWLAGRRWTAALVRGAERTGG